MKTVITGNGGTGTGITYGVDIDDEGNATRWIGTEPIVCERLTPEAREARDLAEWQEKLRAWNGDSA